MDGWTISLVAQLGLAGYDWTPLCRAISQYAQVIGGDSSTRGEPAGRAMEGWWPQDELWKSGSADVCFFRLADYWSVW